MRNFIVELPGETVDQDQVHPRRRMIEAEEVRCLNLSTDSISRADRIEFFRDGRMVARFVEDAILGWCELP